VNMEKRIKKTLAILSSLIVALIMAIMIFAPVRAEAATKFTDLKPTINTKKSAYLYDSVYLKWNKINGAKKYIIERAKVNPSTGKIGKWTSWANTKNTYIKKKATGDFKYRVRAVNSKGKVTKWSKARRIFAATARITKVDKSDNPVNWGWGYKTDGTVIFTVVVNNKTKSTMGFLRSGYEVPNQCTVYALNKSTGKVRKKFEATLDASIWGSSAGYKKINASSKGTITFYCYVSYDDWKYIKNSNFMLSSSFYPNGDVEGIDTQLAISYTGNAKKASVSSK